MASPSASLIIDVRHVRAMHGRDRPATQTHISRAPVSPVRSMTAATQHATTAALLSVYTHHHETALVRTNDNIINPRRHASALHTECNQGAEAKLSKLLLRWSCQRRRSLRFFFAEPALCQPSIHVVTGQYRLIFCIVSLCKASSQGMKNRIVRRTEEEGHGEAFLPCHVEHTMHRRYEGVVAPAS